ncbi:MAG TPA: hypothetical protein VNR00_07070, partial [Opitutus sp.]|nr:hypothetical protein [Opitutus sp.]
MNITATDRLPAPRLRRLFFAGSCFALACASQALSAMEIPYDFHVRCTPENSIFGYFSATKKPVLTIKSGAVVRIDGGGGNKWGENANPDEWLKQNGVAITVESNEALKEIVTA